MKKILLWCTLLITSWAFAQTTVTIGTGATGSSYGNGSPIYRSSATSVYHYTKSVQLLTAADLSAAAVTSGATITKIAYNKATAFNVSGANEFQMKVYLKNSSATTLTSGTAWDTMITGATLFYDKAINSSNNFPATADWVNLDNSTGNVFNYSGGSIEVYIDWAINSPPGVSPWTGGAFTWKYDSVTGKNQSMGTSNSTALPGSTASFTTNAWRFQTQLTFTSTPCSGTPTPGNTIITGSNSCPGPYNATLSLQNSTTGSGVTYQWYKNGTAITGATSSTYTTSITAADSYYCAVTCTNSTSTTNSTTAVAAAPAGVYTIPFTEGFENNNTDGSAINCYSQVSITGSSAWTANKTQIDYNRTPRTGLWNAFLQYGNERWFFIPIQLTGGTAYQVSLYARQDMATATDASMMISYGTAATAAAMTNTIVPATGIINGNYQKISGNFTPATTGIYYVGIKGNINSTPWYISLDDISIDVAPTCLEPTGFTASAITSTGATLSWTAPTTAPANGYNVYYSTSNTAPVATTTPNWSGTTTTTNLSSLSPNTQYFAWVRSNCSASSQSTWLALPSFTTTCSPYTIPYNEGFETGYTNAAAVAGCLTQEAVTSTAVWTANQTATTYNRAPRTGSWNAYLQYGNERWIFIPVQLTGGTAYQASLYARQDDVNSADASMLISYGTAATAAAMTNSIVPETSIINGDYQKISGNFVPATTGTYYVGIKGKMNSNPWYISLDDIAITLAPTCLEPTALTASAITANSATLSWSAPNPAPVNGYDVYYSTTNTAPVATTTPNWSGTATTTNLSSLTSNTQYFVWVRSNCSTSDKSTWVPSNFVTTCTATNVPYTQDFETTTVPAIPNCSIIQNAGAGNNWTTSNNPGYGFTTKTLRYGYNFTNKANAWFYTQGINMTAGTNYTISFDYGNDSSTSYVESLKVAFGTSAVDTSMTGAIIDLPTINQGAKQTGTYTFTVPANGVYYFGFNAYSIANQNQLFVDNISITLSVAGTSEIANTKEGVKVYPNPFTEVLNISDVRNVKTISIVDASGRMVKTIDKPTAQLQLGDLTSGMYILTLHYNNGTTKTVKAMKK